MPVVFAWETDSRVGEAMTALDWRDGGNKPLQYAEKCAICGEQIMVPTRDYFYAYDENKKSVRAHAACAQKAMMSVTSGPSTDFEDHLIDELMMIREQLALMNGHLAKLIEQGAH